MAMFDHPENLMMNNLSRTTVFVAALALTSITACAQTRTHESTGQYVDDSALTTKVKAAILADDSLKSSEINVESFKGTVQLSGFVRSQANINQAVAVAQGVNGVVHVKNDMQLK
jgi:osmotically-inducible protein OsmY